MSRRQPTSSVEQNRATLKSLVKLEANKSCADCKKNKHPRWASWNLGIFICIRCSGIHRGMGTHISRVKSVDLDSWTDEQTQSMLKWGNARANKYWEAKLAPGHVPSESKMENFIRTKFESKRWAMDGPMPDPSELDGGEDETQTATAQSSASVERSSSQRQVPASRKAPAASIDLFGDSISAPPRPATGPPLGTQPPPKAEAAPPRQTKPAESLLGFDFFGTAPAAPARPASDLGGMAGMAAPAPPSKTDLKQSILSLYASAPKPAPQPQVQSPGFGNLQSTPQAAPNHSAFGGMNDAFSSLTVSSPGVASTTSKPSAFAGLTSSYTSAKPTTTTTTPSLGAGGSFFDPLPKSPPTTQSTAPPPVQSNNSGFGDLFSSPPPSTTQQKPAPSLSADLFDLSAPSPVSTKTVASSSTANTSFAPASSNPMSSMSSAFNLSSTTSQTQPSPKPVASSAFANVGPSMDAWGSSDVWGAPEKPTTTTSSTTQSSTLMDPGWGSTSSTNTFTKSTKPAETTIAGDEDFGGWNSAPVAPSNTTSSSNKNAGSGLGGNNDDLFGNVWG